MRFLTILLVGLTFCAPALGEDSDTSAAGSDPCNVVGAFGGCLPPAPNFEQSFDGPSCAAWEAMAVGTCLGGALCVGFGVLTLGVSPVFANVPLPVGVFGICFGALGLAQGLYFACAAPWLPPLHGEEGLLPTAPEQASDEHETSSARTAPQASAQSAMQF